MINDKTNEAIEEFFRQLFAGYQTGLKTTMKGASIIFDYVHLSYYKYH